MNVRYFIAQIEDLFNKLHNRIFFRVLDVHKLYFRVKVDKESSQPQTMLTHRGTCKVKRLFFGTKTMSNERHGIINWILQNLEGIVLNFDDVTIQRNTYEDC